jgi:integrase
VRRVERPKLVEPEIRVPTIEELRAVLATANDRRSFLDVRDTAVIRLWLDTGIRRSELTGLRLSDVDLTTGQVTVTGKGRKIRTVAFGATTSTALARYFRLRARHPLANRPELWLGDRNRGPVSSEGLGEHRQIAAHRRPGPGHRHQLPEHLHRRRRGAAGRLRAGRRREGAAFGRLRDRHGGGTGPLPAGLVDPAERIYAELVTSSAPAVLLHVALHHDNVLRAGRAACWRWTLCQPLVVRMARVRNWARLGS